MSIVDYSILKIRCKDNNFSGHTEISTLIEVYFNLISPPATNKDSVACNKVTKKHRWQENPPASDSIIHIYSLGVEI